MRHPKYLSKPFYLFLGMTLIILGCVSCKDSGKKDPKKTQKAASLLLDSMTLSAGKGDFKGALAYLSRLEKDLQTTDDTALLLFCKFEKGRLNYALSAFSDAESEWLKALAMAYQLDKKADIAALNTNLGTIYMQKGYVKTAIDYFLAAREVMEALGKKDDNYWKNYLNIGVAYMELEQYDEADSVFSNVKLNSSKVLSFLYYLNRAKLSALRGNQAEFKQNIDSTNVYLVGENLYYLEFLNQLKLEFYIQFNDVESMKSVVYKYRDSTRDLSPYYIVLLNKAALLTEGTLISRLSEIQALEKQIIKDRNSYLSVVYHDLLAAYYESLNDYKSEVNQLKLVGAYKDSLKKESSSQAMGDFTLLTKKSTQKELQLLKAKNQANVSSIRNQRFLLLLFILILILTSVASVLYYKNSKKDKNLQEAELLIKNNLLKQSMQEQEALQINLKFEAEKLKEIMSNINKIAVLKKQLDNFIDEMEQNILLKEQKTDFKRAKVNIDAFFNNYADLAVLASVKDKDITKFQLFNTRFTEVLSTHEMQVLMMVYNNFTTKEIAILLSKSEKGIEYTRTQIRKKLDIPGEVSLAEFLDQVVYTLG